jgi:2-polyprenyl-3-methyl-5-hydroxy-6-metoxy-1,4-benzoquinol methylase
MRKIPDELLREMSAALSADDAAEMAIPSYLHRRRAMRTMAWWRVSVLAKRLEIAAGRRRDLTIVDFGCGSGVLFEEASIYAKRIHGVDIVLGAAKILVDRWGLAKVVLAKPDEAARDIEPGSVDIILAGEVLEHVEPLGPTLDLFKRWLHPDRGMLLVTLPTESPLYRMGRKLAGFSGHYHHSNASSIDEEILAHGLTREHVSKIPAGGPFAIYWCADYKRS